LNLPIVNAAGDYIGSTISYQSPKADIYTHVFSGGIENVKLILDDYNQYVFTSSAVLKNVYI
jgi:hypothetical protein